MIVIIHWQKINEKKETKNKINFESGYNYYNSDCIWNRNENKKAIYLKYICENGK